MPAKQRIEARVRSVMEDPSARAVARVYAEAFLKASESAGVENALEEFGSFLDDVLKPHPEFQALLFSGLVSRDERLKLIDRVVAPFGSPLFVNFLRVLARHERLELLPSILEEGRAQHESLTGRQRVQVTSARPLGDETVRQIEQRLRDVLSKEPILEIRVDPALLGGLVIQVGDTVHDSSLRTRLKRLRERLRQRSLDEIQSRRDRFSPPEGD